MVPSGAVGSKGHTTFGHNKNRSECTSMISNVGGVEGSGQLFFFSASSTFSLPPGRVQPSLLTETSCTTRLLRAAAVSYIRHINSNHSWASVQQGI